MIDFVRALRAVLLVGILFGVPVHAQTGPTPEAVLDNHFSPTPVPDRIALTLNGDPATSVAVSWRTDPSVTSPIVQVAVATPAPELEDLARTIPATTQVLETENGIAHHHTATLTDLQPETLYAYRVGDGTVWSEWIQYRTASLAQEPFSFIFFGDAQVDVRSYWSRAIRSAFRAAPDARFIVMSGDLVNLREGNHDTEWGGWFSAGGWLSAMVPIVSATGNHEYVPGDAAGAAPTLGPHWTRQFAFPQDGPQGLEGTVFHVDYQGVRVIALNSTHAIELGSVEEQARWLEARLRDNPNRWTIVTFHHPIYSTREGRDNPQLREHWQPLFERYGVDLVLQGHDHAYARGEPVTTAARAESAQGPVYVVSVSGAAMYDLGPNSEWADQRTSHTQLFQTIHIDGDHLTFEARTVTGEIFDGFELVKNPEGGSSVTIR